jgi:regulator of CtrA degradation
VVASGVERMSDRGVQSSDNGNVVSVAFGERYLGSDKFQQIYREGMDLVELTAKYLDGSGRQEGKALNGAAALSFATESMRLTTRLMNLASWLLIRRSVNNGEMTQERARRERLKLKVDTIGRPSHIKAYEELPERLRGLIEASYALQDKIVKLDRLFDGGAVLAAQGAAAPEAMQPVFQAERPATKLRLVYDADAE